MQSISQCHCTVQPVLSKHLRDNQNVLALYRCILVYLPVLVNDYVCLIQVACLIEMAIKIGFTVYNFMTYKWNYCL